VIALSSQVHRPTILQPVPNFLRRGLRDVDESNVGPCVRQLTLELPHVHCAACRAIIIDTLEGVDGVAGATVDTGTRCATVMFDTAKVSEAAIATALTAAGYPPLRRWGASSLPS
jgi:copper chaperone CopZ